MVHYVARGSADGVFPPACRAATITQAGAWVDVPEHSRGEFEMPEEPAARYRERVERWHGDAVHLHVMNPTGTFTYGPMVYDAGQASPPGQPSGLCTNAAHEPGSWHWPARV